jgi:hypothetical protein
MAVRRAVAALAMKRGKSVDFTGRRLIPKLPKTAAYFRVRKIWVMARMRSFSRAWI